MHALAARTQAHMTFRFESCWPGRFSRGDLVARTQLNRWVSFRNASCSTHHYPLLFLRFEKSWIPCGDGIVASSSMSATHCAVRTLISEFSGFRGVFLGSGRALTDFILWPFPPLAPFDSELKSACARESPPPPSRDVVPASKSSIIFRFCLISKRCRRGGGLRVYFDFDEISPNDFHLFSSQKNFELCCSSENVLNVCLCVCIVRREGEAN